MLAAEALGKELDVGAHFFEGQGVTKAIFVDGFMDDRSAAGLRQEYNKRLLPIGHKAWMYVGLQM